MLSSHPLSLSASSALHSRRQMATGHPCRRRSRSGSGSSNALPADRSAATMWSPGSPSSLWDWNADRRPGSSHSEISAGSSGSDYPESIVSISDEEAAGILMLMSRNGTPFSTPSPPTAPVAIAADCLDYVSAKLRLPPLAPWPAPQPTAEDEPSAGTATTATPTRSGALKRDRRGNTRQTRSAAAPPKAASKSPAPLNVSLEQSAAGVDLAGLSPAEAQEVQKRPRRDQRKAAAIIGFRNNPAKYVQVAPRCARCEASDWQCFKRIPETENNKPGPARGWGRGCVSCHKSACSFASDDAE